MAHTVTSPKSQPDASAETEELREQGGADFMGAGFLDDLYGAKAKRRAYEFWYHPYTELAIFALIILSVTLLLVEVTLPTGEPVGWLGGLAAGGITGWFFWADAVITLLFVIEYGSKWWITPWGRKWFFVRNSWIELLALLPVLRVFRLFRIFRAVRVFRVIRVLRSVRLMRTGAMINSIFDGFGSSLGKNRGANIVVIAYFFSAMAFGTIGVMIFEQGADSGFDTLGDGLWWCIVTLSTVGYGDMVPETGGGRIVASIVVVLGLGFWSLVTGVFTSTLVKQARRKETIGLDVLGIENHIAICGWNENGVRLVNDFRAQFPIRHLLVIAEDEVLGVPVDSRLHHVGEDPTTESALEAGRIDKANTVVVLACTQAADHEADVEARTLMTCLAIRTLNAEARIVVELLNDQNVSNARSAGATDVIVTDNYAGSLISQSVRSPGIHRAYSDLLNVGQGSKFSEIKVPDDLQGLSFSEAATRMFFEHDATLIGLRRKKRLQIAPDDTVPIGAGDRAIIIESAKTSRRRR